MCVCNIKTNRYHTKLNSFHANTTNVTQVIDTIVGLRTDETSIQFLDYVLQPKSDFLAESKLESIHLNISFHPGVTELTDLDMLAFFPREPLNENLHYYYHAL